MRIQRAQSPLVRNSNDHRCSVAQVPLKLLYTFSLPEPKRFGRTDREANFYLAERIISV